MRVSQYLLATHKETPAEAELASHRLMLRAGMIRKLASGLYTWLPLGLRVLRKVTAIVREEMDRAGALEVTMPMVQPAQLWQESGRWDDMGPELLRFRDRHEREFCLGPTHEEVITELARNEYGSYRQLPVILYQIQTKFRDERRPRFGVMRAREFLMKDAYSFHIDHASLQESYALMHRTYCAIFDRLGFAYRAVAADPGAIGGSASHEFHVLADSGEDEIVFSDGSDYAANIELATGTPPPAEPSAPSGAAREKVATGDAGTIAAVSAALGIAPTRQVKTLIVRACGEDNRPNGQLVALFLRGDQELSEHKAQRLPGVCEPLEFASDEEIVAAIGCPPGCLGPVNLKLRKIADPSAAALCDFTTGANAQGYHFVNCNWNQDETTRYDETADIRRVREGDRSPDGKGRLSIKRGIEVGHIFQLGDKYSKALNARVLDEGGRALAMPMGCYGIGVTRIVAACIEQNHDERGIIWPEAIAPFRLIIVTLDAHKSERVTQVAEWLYERAHGAGLDVLLDDRDRKTSPGVKLAESELIGIPHRIVVSARTLAGSADGDQPATEHTEQVEYRRRGADQAQRLAVADADGIDALLARLAAGGAAEDQT